MIVANNIIAMNAQRQFNIVGLNKKKSTEKLASGYKINRAADDAAGLTISEKMRSQIRGLHQASENCQDGVSYVQVADGALNEVQDMLHRMTELSVKAANGTNTDQDRAAINKELQQITSEMQRIFTETEFNTKKIWDEPEVEDSKKIQIGTENVIAISRVDHADEQQYRITNSNIVAFPKNSVVNVSADSDGLQFSWVGYNGNNYQTKKISWDEKIGGTHTIHIGDHLDKASYPELDGIDYEYTYIVDDRVNDFGEIINTLNGDRLSIRGDATFVETYTDENGVALPIHSADSLYVDANLLFFGEANLEIDDYDFIKSTNGGNNVTSNPL